MRGPASSFIGMTNRAVLTALAFSFLGVTAAAADIIIYGGMGHLSNRAQPIFGSIFEQRQEGTAHLRQELETVLRENVASTSFAWSDYPVVFDFRDANGIMAERRRAAGLGWNNIRPTILEMQETIGRVYTLAIVADLELVVQSEPLVEDDDYANMVASSATALLVDMETKEIVLSASDVRYATRLSRNDFLPDRHVRQLLIATYKNAAAVAVSKLATKMLNREPSDEFDRHMVTGTLFPGPVAQRIFGLSPWNNEVSSVCSLPPQCDAAEQCSKLIGLVSAVATSALSNAEKLVLPPIGWTYWADRSTNLIALNLVQPRGGLLEEVLTIKLPPESAEVKVLMEMYVANPRIVRTTQEAADQRVWLGSRFDTVTLKLYRYKTDPRDCAQSPAAMEILSVEGTHKSLVSAGDRNSSERFDQLYLFGAILDAGLNLEREIQ